MFVFINPVPLFVLECIVCTVNSFYTKIKAICYSCVYETACLASKSHSTLLVSVTLLSVRRCDPKEAIAVLSTSNAKLSQMKNLFSTLEVFFSKVRT